MLSINRRNRLMFVVFFSNFDAAQMNERHGFVADGYNRARDANEPVVRSEVEREFATMLEEASAADRKRIRRRIERAIDQRLNELAPPDALY